MAREVERAAGTAAGVAAGGGFSPVSLGIAAGVLVLGSIWGLAFRERRKSAFETTSRLAKTRRLPVADAQYVVGRARTGGTVFAEADRSWGAAVRGGAIHAAGGAYDSNDTRRTRYIYTGNLLSHGTIASVDTVWFQGNEVPTVSDGAKGLKSEYDALRTRIDGLRTHMKALIPGSIDASNLIVESVLTAADAAAVELWYDLARELSGLQASDEWREYVLPWFGGNQRRNGWDQRWRVGRTAFSAPALRITWADGTDAGSADARARALAKFPGWRSTDLGEGIGWVLSEARNWERRVDEDRTELFPFRVTDAPDFEFLVRGDPDLAHSSQPAHGANPVKSVKRFMMEECDWSEENLIDFETEGPFCDVVQVIPAVARTDAAAPTSQKPITGPMVLESLYGEDLPSTAVQDRVLAEWNRRYAGTENGRPRYSANGIIDPGMSRDEVLEAHGTAMCGAFVIVGDKCYARVGRTRTPVVTFTEADIVGGAVTWQPDAGGGRAPNSLVASIAQDMDQGWTRTDLDPVDDDVLVERDGLYRLDIGGLDLVNNELDARRLLHLYLRRDAYGLRRAAFTVKVDSAVKDSRGEKVLGIIPEDWVGLNVEGVEMLARVLATRHGFGVVDFQVIEVTNQTYEPTYLLPSTTRDFTTPPTTTGDYDLDEAFEVVWRADGQVYRLDIVPRFGTDVGSLRVRMDLTHERVPMGGTKGNPVTYHYILSTAPASGTAFTLLSGVTGELDPAKPEAAFTRNAEWDVKVTLTPYSARPYTTTNLGDAQGEPRSKTVKGPGRPGAGTGVGLTYDTVGEGTARSLVISGLRVTDGGTLVWRWADVADWAVVAAATTSTHVIAADGSKWNFTALDTYSSPATRTDVLFASRMGAAGSYTYSPPLAFALAKDPRELNRIVSAAPTQASDFRFDDEVLWTVEPA